MKTTRHTLPLTAPLHQALSKLNALSGGAMTLFVTDPKSDRVVGALTDGDLRRGLLRGLSMDSPVADAMNSAFGCVTTDCQDVRLVEALRQLRQRGIRLVPVLTPSGTLHSLIDLNATVTRLPLQAILMAGGKGERLRPLTLTTPKPLLEVAGMPIIDHNIKALARVGITEISVTTNYLAEQIEAHFAHPRFGVQVHCVREHKPLGTIGSASLVPLPQSGQTLVMNSDLLTDISFEDMYLHHISTHAAITVAVITYNVSVPYAILSTEADRVTALQEKPTYSYYANAGIYIIDNVLLQSIAPDTRTDATDLLQHALDNHRKVSYFPISGSWIDIGSPNDYARAKELNLQSR